MVDQVLQQILGGFALLSFGVPTAPPDAQALIEADNKSLVAQLGAVSLCRRVKAENGLIVREKPSLNSPAIDVLPNHSTVTIENVPLEERNSGWVPLKEPQRGYVFTDYLTAERPFLCSERPNRCARVTATNGLNVRQRPTDESPIITTLNNSQTVNVSETVDASRWVEINDPVNGFVNSKYLGAGPHSIPVCEE